MTKYSEILDQLAANVRKAGIRQVRFGEPTSSPNNETAYLWYAGENDKRSTLGNVMVEEIVRCRVYWKRPESGQLRSSQEAQLWETTRRVQEALRADSDIGGDATDMKVANATTGWVPVSGAMLRVTTMDVHVWLYEEEAISA